MSTLVVVEHNNTEVKSVTYNCIAAALKINTELDLIVIGNQCEKVATEVSKIQNIKKVLYLDDEKFENPIAENFKNVIVSIAKNYKHILAPASTFGKNIMPCIAASLDLSQISDVIKIESEDTFVRPIYAGNALATVQSSDNIKIITIRPTSFDPFRSEEGNASIEKISFNENQTLVEFIKREESKSDRPELGTARIVVSGGRGLQSSENFSMINELADKLNAAIGASRAAVDAGYVSNDYQVGQTGKVVAPELYIAVGISGAIQHLAGMKDSKIIVAINKDEEAPIFQVADYGIVGDLFKILPELSKELDKIKS